MNTNLVNRISPRTSSPNVAGNCLINLGALPLWQLYPSSRLAEGRASPLEQEVLLEAVERLAFCAVAVCVVYRVTAPFTAFSHGQEMSEHSSGSAPHRKPKGRASWTDFHLLSPG